MSQVVKRYQLVYIGGVWIISRQKVKFIEENKNGPIENFELPGPKCFLLQ